MKQQKNPNNFQHLAAVVGVFVFLIIARKGQASKNFDFTVNPICCVITVIILVSERPQHPPKRGRDKR